MSFVADTNSSQAGEASEDSTEAALVIEAFILCAIIVIAVGGNVSIWIIILKNRVLRTITNMFILGLSAADLLVSIANMPLTVVSLLTHQWPLPDVACIVFGFINMLTLVTSVMSLCNISINRYFMVCRPTKFQDIYTKRTAILMIIGVVSLSIVLSSPPLFGWGEYAYIPVQSFCFCDWANHLSYAFFMIICCFGGPCSVMTVCNIFIYRAVRASGRKLVRGMPTETSSIITVQINNHDHSQPIRTSNSLNGNVVSSSIHHCSSKNKLIASSENMRTDIDRIEVTASNHNNSLPSENNLVEFIGTKNTNCEEPDIVNNSSPGKFLEEQSNTVDIEVVNEGVCDGENSMKEVCDGENSTNDADNQTEIRESKPRSTIRSSRLSSVTVTRISECSSTGRSLQRHSSKLKRREEHRLAMSLIVVVIVFVICWLPFCISMLIMIFAKTPVPREFHMFTLLLGYANSGCNPIIYGLMNKRFAAGFKDLYCFWKKHFRMPVITTP